VGELHAQATRSGTPGLVLRTICDLTHERLKAAKEVFGTGELRFPSGALAVIESSFTAALQQTFSFTGESGTIELPHDAFIPWEKDATFTLRGDNDEQGQIETVPGADEYQLMIEHFADALQGHTQLAISPGDSVNQMRILDALARTAGVGEVVQLGDRDWFG
jgi:predicted dehydrogenase